MMKSRTPVLTWREVTLLRPFDITAIYELLTNLTTSQAFGRLVWEVRGQRGSIRYLLGIDHRFLRQVEKVFQAHLQVQFTKASRARKAMVQVHRLKTTKPILSLKTDNALSLARATLAVLAQAKGGEEIALQIILGRSHAPRPAASNPADPHATWLDVIRGAVSPASSDSKNAMRDKLNCHSFNAVIRVGVSAKSQSMARAHAHAMLSALRTIESAGTYLSSHSDKPVNLDTCRVPWHVPQAFSVKELACLFLLPIGEEDYAGIGGLHPKLLPAPPWLKPTPFVSHERIFGVTADNKELPLNITPRDSLEHTILLGPTGAGKSTAMLNLITADIAVGRSVLVIDPKADLVNDVLVRIPESRLNEVVVLDPSDYRPVGFNPLHVSTRQNSNLVADAVLAVLKEIFADSWGIRTQDILTGALLTLTQIEGSSLVMLPTLLTDESFRRRIVSQMTDTVGLLPFWAGYEAMGKAERGQAIAPVLNKLRQFILRPELRNILGQSQPKFSLSDLFHSRKVILVPLNKGIIGAENARLLGSLIVGLTWTLALSRANLPAERRHIVSVFIDELQDYIALPTNLSDALSQARGLGVGITMAHQYRAQLTPEIRAGIDANARNKIVFGLNATDAREMAMQAPELTAEDFMRLPRFGVYANLQVSGKSSGWISGRTNPAPPAMRDAVEVRAISQERYGKRVGEVEREYLDFMGYSVPRDLANLVKENNSKGGDDVIGRKRKTD